MTIHYYPDLSSGELSPGSVKKFIEHLAKSDPALYALVKETIAKLGAPGATFDIILPSWVERLGNLGVPISELRIPPTKSGGVVRLYFCMDGRLPNAIIILDGEIKRNNKAKAGTKQAVKRYKEIKNER